MTRRLQGALAACALAALAGPLAVAQTPGPQTPGLQTPETQVAGTQTPAATEPTRLLPAAAVKLRALDKITGNSKDLMLKIGETRTYGRIKVTARACWQAREQDTPESEAFLEVRSATPAKPDAAKTDNVAHMNKGPQPIGPDGLLFSGWMFASSPGLNALQHPTYDVWVISCSASAP